MDYFDALRFLRDRAGYDRGFITNPFAEEEVGLLRTAYLCRVVGMPQQRFRSVHIAGTKGKGSTAAILATILQAAGYRVGLYSSPHLHTIRERIRTNGVPITPELFAALLAELAAADRALQREHPEWGGATAFELVTVLSFLAFARAGVDWAIIEVGLGGRLDATNVLLPDVAVITVIGYDHMQILGSTLEAIAREKAGIIKPGRPVVSAPQASEAAEVLEAVARERGAPLWLGGRDWVVTGQRTDFAFQGESLELGHLALGLRGSHQVENAGVALATVERLRAKGVDVSEEAIRQGLLEVTWPGRLEVLQERPLVVVDGAHNRESAERLARALQEEFSWSRLWLVLGVLRDKEIVRIVAALAPLAAGLFAVEGFAPRAAEGSQLLQAWEAVTRSQDRQPPRELASCGAVSGSPAAPSAEKPTSLYPSVAAALRAVLQQAGEHDLILVTGSLSMAAQAREALGKAEPDPREQEILLG